MNIVTRFTASESDQEVFDHLKKIGQFVSGEVNVVVSLPDKMKAFKDHPQILLGLAEGVVQSLPRAPEKGVTFVGRIQGLAGVVRPGNEKGKFNASISFSAEITSFFEL